MNVSSHNIVISWHETIVSCRILAVIVVRKGFINHTLYCFALDLRQILHCFVPDSTWLTPSGKPQSDAQCIKRQKHKGDTLLFITKYRTLQKPLPDSDITNTSSYNI